MAAIRIGMIDLIIAVITDLDACITRNRKQRYPSLLLIDCGKYQCIAPPAVPISAVNPHKENIGQIVPCRIINTAQRSRHKISAQIVDRTHQYKRNEKNSSRILDKSTVIAVLLFRIDFRFLFHHTARRPLCKEISYQYSRNKSSMQIERVYLYKKKQFM